jgi:hypothetical protein
MILRVLMLVALQLILDLIQLISCLALRVGTPCLTFFLEMPFALG